MKQVNRIVGVPTPRGPYSPAVIASGKILFVAGQIPADPATGAIVGTTFADQAVQAFENVKTIVEGSGAKMSDAVRVGVFLTDLKNFAEMNDIYRRYFPEPYPARTTVQAGLPAGALIEVDAIFALPE